MPERLRLRAFQARLSERLQAAREDRTQREQKLAVMMGQTRYLFDLGEVAEIMAAGSVTRVPLTQDWYVGLVNVRGNLIGVVDYARFIGGALQQDVHGGWLVVPAPTLPVPSGILVSRVIGVVDLQHMALTPVLASHDVGIKQHYRDEQGHPWLEMSLTALMADSRFLHVAL